MTTTNKSITLVSLVCFVLSACGGSREAEVPSNNQAPSGGLGIASESVSSSSVSSSQSSIYFSSASSVPLPSSLSTGEISRSSEAATSDIAQSSENSFGSSDSSLIVSSTSSSQVAVDTSTALKIIDEHCSSCHFGLHKTWLSYDTDEAWRLAQSREGESYIDPLDPQDSLLLRRIKFYGGEDADMPLDNAAQSEPFTRAEYDVLVSWVNSFAVKAPEVIADGSVAITDSDFSEQGVSVTLSCEVDESLTLNLRDPRRIELTSIADYLGVTSREDGVTLMMAEDVATEMDDGTFVLNGAGLDIWDDSIYFNALSMPVEGGQLDLTLDVLSVDGVEHDFAKVGLLVTDSDDLSGQMVFVHWSGRAGLAEDSGVGVLDGYRKISANPNTAEQTPTPARLRVAYQNDVLKVGGCYGCESPAVGLPKDLNFKPAHVYVVASSHTEGAIQARLGLMDAYATEGRYAKVHEQVVDCVDGTASVQVPASSEFDVDGVERLHAELYRGDSLVAASSLVKEFSEMASCEQQDELLSPKLRRLSQQQIQNSIESVFGDVFADTIWPELDDGAKLIGMDTTADKLNINNLNFERLYGLVQSVSATLLSSDTTVKACAEQTSSTCVMDWLTDNGKRLWRRPVTSDEHDALAAAVAELDNNQERMAFAIHSVLLSSNFFFRSEIGTLSEGYQKLSNYEVVSTLSYALVNTAPDDELLALAGQVEPLSVTQLRTQAERLLATPAAKKAMMLVYKDYLKLDLVLTRPKAEELGFTDTVRRDVLKSAELSLEDSIAANQKYTEVFLGSDFYINDAIDYLFNTESSSSVLEKVALGDHPREGLLNHPAFLSVHSTLANSGIVKRGVFSLEQLLCQELPDPPGDVMPQPVPEGVDPDTTSERDLLQITHSAQSACFGCHQIIDPAGFGFENFDAIGRYRTVEKDNVPIDASGRLDSIGDHVLSYNNSAEYATELVSSPQMEACVSRRFLESFLGQDLPMNACEVKRYQRLLSESDGSVQDLLYALIELESFSRRRAAQ